MSEFPQQIREHFERQRTVCKGFASQDCVCEVCMAEWEIKKYWGAREAQDLAERDLKRFKERRGGRHD